MDIRRAEAKIKSKKSPNYLQNELIGDKMNQDI